jgi:acetyltransferase-like isoleucine patch superfamily enzyme
MNSELIHKLIKELGPTKHALPALEKYGLYASNNIKQIGGPLEYESSIRLSTAVLIGACRVGAFSYIGGGSEIRKAHIGRFCCIAANVAIGPAEHPADWLSSHPFVFDGIRYFESDENWQSFATSELKFGGNSAVTEIGNDVWIGRNAIIKQGVKVGNGAIIAGGAFVSKDVPDYAIVGGVPARQIRYRFDSEIIELLKSIKWWEYKLESSFHSINFSEIRQSVDQISSLIMSDKLAKFNPKIYILNNENEKFRLFEVTSS